VVLSCMALPGWARRWQFAHQKARRRLGCQSSLKMAADGDLGPPNTPKTRKEDTESLPPESAEGAKKDTADGADDPDTSGSASASIGETRGSNQFGVLRVSPPARRGSSIRVDSCSWVVGFAFGGFLRGDPVSRSKRLGLVKRRNDLHGGPGHGIWPCDPAATG